MPEDMKVVKETENESVRFFAVQGEIKIEVFYEKANPNAGLMKSIDQVDKLPIGYFTNLMSYNSLPCDPLDRTLMRPVIMGMIQLAWHKAFKGAPTPKLIDNQQNRVNTYLRDLEHLKLTQQNPGQRAATARAPRAPKTPKDPNAASLGGHLRRLKAEAMTKWVEFTGQKGVIIAAMMAAGAFGPDGPGISSEVLATACRGKFNTRQTEERIVGFYFAEWARQEIVEEPPKELPAVKEVPPGWEGNVLTKEAIAKIKADSAAQVEPAASPEAKPVEEPVIDPKPDAKKGKKAIKKTSQKQ